MKGKGLLIIIGVIVLFVFMGIGSYNNLVSLDEEMSNAWAQVENQLKRRADLIPNLVETVKGYASHETEVIDSITAARAQYANANTPQEYAQADAGLTNAIKSLNVIVENYPDLKANQNFADLQAELAGTENRVATERMRYNETVKEFNQKIKKLPTKIWAGLLGFEEAEYFEISEQDAEVPKVNF
jgi:LemA protein